MIKLYEIMDQYKILQETEIETDEDLAAFAELAKKLDGTFDQKAVAYCQVIRNIEAEAEAFKAEKLRLEKKQKALENRAKCLKSWLEGACKELMQEGEKRQVGMFTLALQKNPPAVKFDELHLPDEYFDKTPNKAMIKEDLLKGIDVEGAYLEQSVGLRIK